MYVIYKQTYIAGPWSGSSVQRQAIKHVTTLTELQFIKTSCISSMRQHFPPSADYPLSNTINATFLKSLILLYQYFKKSPLNEEGEVFLNV